MYVYTYYDHVIDSRVRFQLLFETISLTPSPSLSLSSIYSLSLSHSLSSIYSPSPSLHIIHISLSLPISLIYTIAARNQTAEH